MHVVHVADVHLDTSFAGRSRSVRARLRDASRAAFRNAVELAIREDAHAFLIAGDLFDGERLSFQTERFLLEQAQRLEEHRVTVVYATGNHDPGAPETGPRPLPWPSNVHVVADGTPRRIAIPDRDGNAVGWVTAVGHATSREMEDLSRRVPRPMGELPEVGLLHTQVHASPHGEEHHPYAPSELGWLVRSGYDYWALGHVHARQFLSRDPPVVYAGSLQGRTHRETGAHGAYVADLSDRGAPVISFRALAPVRWETLRVGGLEDADSLDRLERRVRAVWDTFRACETVSPDTEWVLRVALEGPSPLWRELRREADLAVVAREIGELTGALDVNVLSDGVHPVVPVEEHKVRPDVLGEALRLIEAVRAGERQISGLDAGDLAGLAGDASGALEQYVKELLEDADGEIAARMLGVGDGTR